MDYKTEYEFYYEKWTSIFERKAKLFFIESKKGKEKFGIAITEIMHFCHNEFPAKVRLSHFDKLKELHELFNNRYSYYEEDEINLIIVKRIEPLYVKLGYNDLPANYNLKKLLVDFARMNVTKEIHRVLQQYNRLFELHYIVNDFSEFQIRDIGNFYIEHYPLYKKLKKIAYPERYIKNTAEALLQEVSLDETDAAFKVFLLEEILHYNNWQDISANKKGKLVSLLIGRNNSNIKKIYLAMEKKNSSLSKKFQSDKADAEKLIKDILG